MRAMRELERDFDRCAFSAEWAREALKQTILRSRESGYSPFLADAEARKLVCFSGKGLLTLKKDVPSERPFQ